MSVVDSRPVVGFIGLGDQGLPMATAIAQAGYTLHVRALHSGSLDALGEVPHVRHDHTEELGVACDIVCLCVSTDKDVMQVVAGGLLDGLRSGSTVVNHGAGTPGNAVRLTEFCARARVEVLDAPVSGGRPAAQKRALTTMVGGPEPVAQRCEPLLAFMPLAMTPTYCATKAAIHSYSQSLRYQLKDTKIKVVELIPPYVQTRLMGDRQAADPRAMPLDAFIAEVMDLITTQPDATEIRVKNVYPQRFSAESGQERYEQAFKGFNDAMAAGGH